MNFSNCLILNPNSLCRNFFRATSQVEDAESHFGIDQYSDITMLSKPVVYITVQEIIDTHQVCTEVPGMQLKFLECYSCLERKRSDSSP